MKKLYLKKFGTISYFIVWIVDGQYIRRAIDKDFTNFGQHWRFKFIPKNEFWLDKERKEDEYRYYVDHLLVENRLMKQGKSYAFALEKADLVEKKERSKSKLLRKYFLRDTRKKIPKEIYKKLLKKYSDKLKIWIVDGNLVRDLFYIDFTEGGHDKVYNFIPKNEIWLDDDVSFKEMNFILLHEIYERNLMCKGWKYDPESKKKKSAHKAASVIEYYCRHHPKLLDKTIKTELSKVIIL